MTRLHKRREVIQRAMAIAGMATLTGSGTLLTACGARVQRDTAVTMSDFSATQVTWLDEVAETILPETDTPGAKAAQTGSFIALMVKDTYSPDEQQVFLAGMQTLESECNHDFSTGFLDATPEQKHELLTRLDVEAKRYMDSKSEARPSHYFRMIKELTVLGYFTSEIGYTQAMRYIETPGRWDPCLDYKPGETIWARHA